MPIYLYICNKCGEREEYVQSYNGLPPVCCGEPMAHLPTCPAKIQMKGDGGVNIHSQGYKEGYAKEYRRRLQDYKGKTAAQ